MVTAVMNNVNIVVLHCCDYIPMSQETLDNLEEIVGMGASALIELGLSFCEARVALAHVRDIENYISVKFCPYARKLVYRDSRALVTVCRDAQHLYGSRDAQ